MEEASPHPPSPPYCMFKVSAQLVERGERRGTSIVRGSAEFPGSSI